MNEFNSKILRWYKKNFRHLPWRETKNPYYIWVSEVILQQTKIDQGLPYFEKFIKKYPKISDLANAKEEEILKLWQGLGYYSRAVNMHFAAKQIMQEFDGKFPDNYMNIIRLKGIGKYSAAAIASIAFNEPKLAVDGNVYRFAARYFGDYEPVNSKQLYNNILKYLEPDLPKNNCGDFNQALIEIGAMICKPNKPLCMECPVHEGCFALRNNCVNELPVKKKKVIVQNRFFNYFLIESKSNFYIQKRSNKDIWKGLFELPMLESDKRIRMDELPDFLQNVVFLKNDKNWNIQHLWSARHVLTHRNIFADFWKIDAILPNIVKDNCLKITVKDLGQYPVSRLTELFFEHYFEQGRMKNDK